MYYLLDFVSALHIGTSSLEMEGVDYFDYLSSSSLIILHQIHRQPSFVTSQ